MVSIPVAKPPGRGSVDGDDEERDIHPLVLPLLCCYPHYILFGEALHLSAVGRLVRAYLLSFPQEERSPVQRGTTPSA